MNNKSELINNLNKEIMQAHLENLKNKVFNNLNIPHILFDDGEVVTDSNGEYYTQIPPAFYGNSFLEFKNEDKILDRVYLTTDQAYKFRDRVGEIKRM
jgi:hypothetical protein